MIEESNKAIDPDLCIFEEDKLHELQGNGTPCILDKIITKKHIHMASIQSSLSNI